MAVSISPIMCIGRRSHTQAMTTRCSASAEVMERRRDRDRPLWECWIIEGLEDNRWAILTKLHHCIAEGIAATHVLASLSDEGDTDSYASQIRAVREVRPRGLQLPKPSLDPRDWVSGMWHTSAAVTNVATRAAEGAIDLAANLLRPTAASSLTGPVTNLRSLQRGAGLPSTM